jgi:hypothetical protein
MLRIVVGAILFGSLLAPAIATAQSTHLLGTWSVLSTSGGTTSVPIFPDGAVVCLINEQIVNLLPADVPYPTLIDSDAVVGCDSLILPGIAYTLEFNSSNSPQFAEFVRRLTDGVDNTVHFWLGQVSGDLRKEGGAVGAGLCESILTATRRVGRRDFAHDGHAPKGPVATCRPDRKTADWIGYTITAIKIHILEHVLTTSADGLSRSHNIRADVEFFGHRH